MKVRIFLLLLAQSVHSSCIGFDDLLDFFDFFVLFIFLVFYLSLLFFVDF